MVVLSERSVTMSFPFGSVSDRLRDSTPLFRLSGPSSSVIYIFCLISYYFPSLCVSFLWLLDVYEGELISRLMTSWSYDLLWWVPIPFLVGFPKLHWHERWVCPDPYYEQVGGLTFWSIEYPVTYLMFLLRTELSPLLNRNLTCNGITEDCFVKSLLS